MKNWKEKVKPNPTTVKKHKRMVRREAGWIERFKEAEATKGPGETVEYAVVKNVLRDLTARRKFTLHENRVLEKNGKLATVNFLVPECGAAIKIGGQDVCSNENEVFASLGLHPLRIKPYDLRAYEGFRAAVKSLAAALNRKKHTNESPRSLT